jgi:hypothetical protein
MALLTKTGTIGGIGIPLVGVEQKIKSGVYM